MQQRIISEINYVYREKQCKYGITNRIITYNYLAILICRAATSIALVNFLSVDFIICIRNVCFFLDFSSGMRKKRAIFVNFTSFIRVLFQSFICSVCFFFLRNYKIQIEKKNLLVTILFLLIEIFCAHVCGKTASKITKIC